MKQDRPVSLSEALRDPKKWNLDDETIHTIKRLQLKLAGHELPNGRVDKWQQLFLLNKSKEPIGHIVNVTLILSNDERWLGENGKPILAWDMMRAQITFRALPPWGQTYAGANTDTWEDEDADRLVAWLGLTYQIKTTSDIAYKAARLIAQGNRYHPIQEMLYKLPIWDDTPRLATWLHTYLGAQAKGADPQYLADVGTWSLISLIARVMKPGEKVDNMLILEGLQGKKKSMFLEVLAGSPKYLLVMNGVELGTKESLELLRGKWVVEMSELDSLNRSEANAAKAFISKGADTYRAAYGREAKDYVRQCVFFGTTNRAVYLQDETGNRRYWPIFCTFLDIEGFKKVRDQLLAEALYLFTAMDLGAITKQWWPESDDEKARCEAEQEARRVADPWEDLIALYLHKESAKEVTIAQLLTDALRIPEGRQTRGDSTRVGLVLQRLGWTIGGRRDRTGPRFYLPPLDHTPTSPQRLDHATSRNDSESAF